MRVFLPPTEMELETWKRRVEEAREWLNAPISMDKSPEMERKLHSKSILEDESVETIAQLIAEIERLRTIIRKVDNEAHSGEATGWPEYYKNILAVLNG